MNTFPIIPAISLTSEIPNLSPEAVELRERLIASMTILTAGICCFARDANVEENQTDSALTGAGAGELVDTITALLAVCLKILEGAGSMQDVLKMAEHSRSQGA